MNSDTDGGGILALAWALVFKLCLLVVKLDTISQAMLPRRLERFATACQNFVPLCEHTDSMSKFVYFLWLKYLQEHADTLYLSANIFFHGQNLILTHYKLFADEYELSERRNQVCENR